MAPRTVEIGKHDLGTKFIRSFPYSAGLLVRSRMRVPIQYLVGGVQVAGAHLLGLQGDYIDFPPSFILPQVCLGDFSCDYDVAMLHTTLDQREGERRRSNE